jgi:uncharacterized membrane protein YjgN (DUF898 family)
MSDSLAPVLDTQAVLSTQLPAGPPPLEAPPQPRRLAIEFTGTGGEYFRIWLVNLLLTIVTLGIYSAWAKVRKTRWFYGNLRLDGISFQYHGRPGAILRGRILVGAFAVAYSLAGRISVQAAAVASVLLGLVAPWLFLKAMRFKLTNSTWRGVRFGFDSTVGQAYAAVVPGVVLWVILSIEATTIRPGMSTANVAPLFVVYGVFFLAIPLLHARLKRWQHRATTWGTVRFDFPPSTGAFYRLYGKAFLVSLAPMAAAAVAGVIVFGLSRGARSDPKATLVPMLVAIYGIMLLAYLVVGAYLASRLQRLVWERTRGEPFRFSTTLPAWGLMGTWLKNGLLTLLTVGLYWPYAAVNIARYQLRFMVVEASGPIDGVAAGSQGIEPSAAGEGAADYFGWDIGL